MSSGMLRRDISRRFIIIIIIIIIKGMNSVYNIHAQKELVYIYFR